MFEQRICDGMGDVSVQAGAVDIICAKIATSGIPDQRSFIDGSQGSYGGIRTTGNCDTTGPSSRVAPNSNASR